MSIRSSVPESIHFSIEPLSDGVFAAIQRKHGWAISNSAIADLGDSCLVFDTFLTVQAASDLRRAAETLTGKPVRYVINSHYHNDHIWGNQVFDSDTLIIGSAETRRLIQSEGEGEYEWYRLNSEKRLQELQEEFRDGQDERERDAAAFWIDYYQPLVNSFAPSGPMSRTTQSFWWTESIRFK